MTAPKIELFVAKVVATNVPRANAWLHKLGGQQRLRQLVAMAANICVVAAVLARPLLSRFEAAERQSSRLDGIDGQCSRHAATAASASRVVHATPLCIYQSVVLQSVWWAVQAGAASTAGGCVLRLVEKNALFTASRQG